MILNLKIRKLVNGPGVYLFKSKNGEVLYVGKSVNVRERVQQHIKSKFTKTVKIVSSSSTVDAISVTSELESLLLEANLIKLYKPKYNTAIKDDKNPLYIKITRGEYPLILTTRKHVDKGIYYGPFPSSQAIKGVLRQVRRVFPYHSQKISNNACFYNHLNLCNPCPALILKSTNKKDKILQTIIYKKNIMKIKKMLDGKSKSLIKNLTSEMKSLSKKHEYEKAGIIRDQIKKLEYITTDYIRPKEYLENPHLVEELRERELNSLHALLSPHFKHFKKPLKIEAYDVSHLSGKNAASSMVTFENGEPNKNLYRHFKVKNDSTNNDYSSIAETLKRRLNHITSWGKPDLIIIDGGKGQVGSARMALKDFKIYIPVIGLAKRLEEIVIPRLSASEVSSKKKISYLIFRLPRNNPSLKLFQRIRDEAHRFARSYHFKLRLKSLYN